MVEGLDACDVRFTKRELREYTQWGQTQLKVHLARLEDHEHVLTHRTGAGASLLHEVVVSPHERAGRALGTTSRSAGVVGPKSGGGRGTNPTGSERAIEPETSHFMNGANGASGANTKNAVKPLSTKIAS